MQNLKPFVVFGLNLWQIIITLYTDLIKKYYFLFVIICFIYFVLCSFIFSLYFLSFFILCILLILYVIFLQKLFFSLCFIFIEHTDAYTHTYIPVHEDSFGADGSIYAPVCFSTKNFQFLNRVLHIATHDGGGNSL